MKKRTLAVLFVCMILLLVGCSNSGKTSQAEVLIGASEKFSNKEIEQAVNAVKTRFKKFKKCELIKLWYDEERSDDYTREYLQNGRGTSNGAKEENVIVLLSDFKTGDHMNANTGFDDNVTHSDWIWILIREDKDSAWVVDDYGYGY